MAKRRNGNSQNHRSGPRHVCVPAWLFDEPTGSRGLSEEIEIIIAAFRRPAVGVAALLRFQNEAAALVGVDPPEIARAVAVVLKHAALEDVIVRCVVGEAAIRHGNADE